MFSQAVEGHNWHAAFDFGGVSYTHSLRTRTSERPDCDSARSRTRSTAWSKARSKCHQGLTQGVHPLVGQSDAEARAQPPAHCQQPGGSGSPSGQHRITSKNGVSTNQVCMIRLRSMFFASLMAVSLHLPSARSLSRSAGAIHQEELARTECNRRTRIIVQAFRWAVENELIPAVNLEALKAVKGLLQGTVCRPRERACSARS